MQSKIISEPIDPLIKKINDTDKKIIFLKGGIGSGKSVVIQKLREINKLNKEQIFVDASINMGEYLILKYKNVYKLYHLSLIMKKILLYIKINYQEQYNLLFSFFDIYIENIIKSILFVHLVDREEDIAINPQILDNPETLFTEFIEKVKKFINISKIDLAFDNFDTNSCERFQKLIYEDISQYVNVLATISDPLIINNKNKLEDLSKNSDIINVQYSYDVDIVKSILDNYSITLLFNNSKYNLGLRVNFLFSNEFIKELIMKTNGNLKDMFQALRQFYNHIEDIDRLNYYDYIINYIDNVINLNPIISGLPKLKRTLYI